MPSNNTRYQTGSSRHHREIHGHSPRNFLDRQTKNRRLKDRLEELAQRCAEFRERRISFGRYQAAARSIIRTLRKAIVRALEAAWGRPDTEEFANSFAI